MLQILLKVSETDCVVADVLEDGVPIGEIVSLGFAFRRRNEPLRCVRAETIRELLGLVRVIRAGEGRSWLPAARNGSREP
jgi:hypothetical protein